jgi:hypothetical protein
MQLSGTTDKQPEIYPLPKPYANRTRKPESSFLGFMSAEIDKLEIRENRRQSAGNEDFFNKADNVS